MPVYLDNAASSPCDPRVVEAMLPYFTEKFGNSLGKHQFGRQAAEGIEHARQQVAALLGAKPEEIIFTSGASEADNLAIKGVAHSKKRGHFITSCAEHKAVLVPMHSLEDSGFEVTFVTPGPPGMDGIVTEAMIAEVIRDDTLLVSIMAANNETGTINEIAGIGRVCREAGALFHTDATQYVGKVPVDVVGDSIDLLSFTGHKMYGPKGAGVLFIRQGDPRIDIHPIIEGGGHERSLRAGTHNTPGIVGLGMACGLCMDEMLEESARLTSLRDKLEARLISTLPGVMINGSAEKRLPNISNLCFGSVLGCAVIEHITAIACSSGSAICTADAGGNSGGGRAASHVLASLGVPNDLAATALRISLGRFTTEQDIDIATNHVIEVITQIASEVASPT